MTRITDKTYVSGPPTGWLDVRKFPPPIGCKALFLNRSGLADIRTYLKSSHVAWMPLPTIEPELKTWISALNDYPITPVDRLFEYPETPYEVTNND